MVPVLFVIPGIPCVLIFLRLVPAEKTRPYRPDARSLNGHPLSAEQETQGGHIRGLRSARLITYRPERACKPGSVTRRWRARGHLSGTMVAQRLKRPTRGLGRAALEHPLIWPCSGWGLPSQPGHPGCWCALTAPFHPYPDSAGRFVFCGTFPRVTPGGRYPPPCPVEPGLSSRSRSCARPRSPLR